MPVTTTMPPKETDNLLPSNDSPPTPSKKFNSHLSFDDEHYNNIRSSGYFKGGKIILISGVLFAFALGFLTNSVVYDNAPASNSTTTTNNNKNSSDYPSGPYKLTELQVGNKFFDYYDFYDGEDSLGSAGYNSYVSKSRAKQLGLFNISKDDDHDVVYMLTAPTEQGPRESIRLEGKTRFDSGLFILDVDHTPAGCGQWPAFWLTDEDNWPDNGEIDILEGVNYQPMAKTALHTGPQCSMFAHVPDYAKTGTWDRSTGLPDTFTGNPDFDTSVPADDCWNMAPHQWQNQGCVAVHDQNNTLGEGFNQHGGGVYALQWDPANRYIRSWVFVKDNGGIPSNLQDAMDTAGDTKNAVQPDPDTWGLPYGYFAIGETTGCSANHFQNMRIVLNTAFCGTVSGNRFFTDCPEQAKTFNVNKDPVKSCNAWIHSQPDELNEAYWKIRGVYVYERT